MTDTVQRFLLVRLSSIGDIVHALPAAAALAATYPRAEIYWAVERRYAVLLNGNPHLRRLILVDTLGWRRHLAASATWTEIFEGVKDLRRVPYAAAIDFQGLWKSAIVARLSGAQERIGFSERWMREPTAAVLYTQRVSPRERIHVVEENLALVERLGARAGPWEFPLPWSDQDDEYVNTQLQAWQAEDFIIMNPGGGWRAKCWPPESYAALARELAGHVCDQVILTGAPAEEGMIEDIIRSAGSARLHYMPATLVQFIALARRARLLIAGDTGPLHLAAAAMVPIVGIYGPTDPRRNGPFAPDDIALSNRGPVNHTRRGGNGAYLAGISVAEVVAAVKERLARVHG